MARHFIGLAGLLLSAGAASAGVIVHFFEQDNNVIVFSVGTFAGLPIGTYVSHKAGPGIDTSKAILNQITTPVEVPVKAYQATGSQNIYWGNMGFVTASSTTGSSINIIANIANRVPPVPPNIWIPEYPGASIKATSVYANTSLNALGFLRSGTLETYTLAGTNETVVVVTPSAPVESCPTSPTPIAKGGLHCGLGNSLVTLTGGGLTTLSGGTIKFQSGRTSPKSMVPMSISPEGASMTYTDQVGVTSDNVVSFIIEAPTGKPFDPTNLDINVESLMRITRLLEPPKSLRR